MNKNTNTPTTPSPLPGRYLPLVGIMVYWGGGTFKIPISNFPDLRNKINVKKIPISNFPDLGNKRLEDSPIRKTEVLRLVLEKKSRSKFAGL